MLSIIAAISILLFTGGFLAIWGLYGRRIDSHPLCRRCRFDLIAFIDPSPPPPPHTHTPPPALPATSSSPSSSLTSSPQRSPSTTPSAQVDRLLICPECGSDVTQPAARRSGNRIRSRWKMALGAVLIAIASLPLALRTLGIGRTALNQFKPVWMLLWEGSSSDAAAAGPALDELLARVHAPQCPERLRESILARAVEYQADERLTWHPGWGAILEWGLLSGRLNEQQRSSFAEHALNIHVLMRARVRHGQEVPFALEFSPARMDPAGTLGATITILDWRGPGAEGSDFRSVMSTSGLSPAGKARMFSRAQVFPPVGEHRLHLECSVLLANPVALQPGPIPATAAQAVLSIPADLSVVETGAPVIQTTREESLGARIRAALRIPRAGVPPPIAAAPARPDATLTFSDTLAVDASATVLYRIAGKEYAAGSLDLRANKPIPVFQLAGPWDPGLAAFRGNRVDLILRFGAEAAERTIDVTQSWEGTVEFLDVPINWGQDGPPPKDLPGPN